MGCIQPVGAPVNSSTLVADNNTGFQQPLISSDEIYWVHINHFGNRSHFGDLLVINGTTNLPAGTNLEIVLYDIERTPGDHVCLQEGFKYGVFTNASVTKGLLNNTWEAEVNTSVLCPRTYFEIVAGANNAIFDAYPFELQPE
jgi:hypothetical protein